MGRMDPWVRPKQGMMMVPHKHDAARAATTTGEAKSSMSQDRPRTGNPVIDTMTKIFERLGKEIDQLIPRPSAPPFPAPADMTDRQLHQAVHDVGVRLLNGLAPVIQQGFARYGS